MVRQSERRAIATRDSSEAGTARSSEGSSRNPVTTRVTSTLNADGTFVYGGGQSILTLHDANRPGGPGSTGMTGTAGTLTGQWKSEGGTLFSRANGQAQWLPLGRYSVSGNDMLLTTANGEKQLWSR